MLHKLFDRSGALLGCYKSDGWHPAIGSGWQIEPAGEPPLPPPGSVEDAGPVGIDVSQIPSGQRYWIDGDEVGRDEALAALDLVDDSDRYHLSIVSPYQPTPGSNPLVDRARDLAGDRVHLHVYGPDDWPVKEGRVGPGITVQKPAKAGGDVVWHADAIDEPAIAEAVRRCDPNYKPEPEPKKPDVKPSDPEQPEEPNGCPNCTPDSGPCPHCQPPAGGDQNCLAWLASMITLLIARIRKPEE